MTATLPPTDLEPELHQRGFGRRRFLGVAGAVATAAFVVACSDDDDGDDASDSTATTAQDDSTTTTTEVERGLENDLDIGATAAGLEVLAVDTYQRALDAAEAGDLGEVPPAVAEYVATALDHHQTHLDAWNDLLTANDRDTVSEPPEELAQDIGDRFAEVSDVIGAAELALSLEETASATYLAVIPAISSEEPIRLASNFHIIDMQHQAILNYVLGEYPVPDTFADTDASITSE